MILSVLTVLHQILAASSTIDCGKSVGMGKAQRRLKTDRLKQAANRAPKSVLPDSRSGSRLFRTARLCYPFLRPTDLTASLVLHMRTSCETWTKIVISPGLAKEFSAFFRAEFLGLPSLFWMVLLVAIPAYVLLS